MDPKTIRKTAAKKPVPPKVQREDRLPEWLYLRYGQPRFRSWSHLSEEDRANWKREAALVRGAVTRDGHDEDET